MSATGAGTVAQHQWTFLTNHGHVMICLRREPDLRVRDLAQRIGITERAVLRIIGELAEAGYLIIAKSGRRNHYQICGDQPLRHPVESGHRLQDILERLG
jgi:predicted ArsR family transcriptional regulator